MSPYNLRNRENLEEKRKLREAEERAKAAAQAQKKKPVKRDRKEAIPSSSSSSEEEEESEPKTVTRAPKKAMKSPNKKPKRSDPDYVPPEEFPESSSEDGSGDEEDELDLSDEDEENLDEEEGTSPPRNSTGHLRSLDELRGIDEIKEQILDSIVYPFVSPKKAAELPLKPPRGLLLTGRPGTGKSVLADAIVQEIRSNGINVKYYKESGSCLSKWVGQSEQNMREVFRMARRTAPSIIFFDELDGLGGTRRNPANTSGGVHNTLITTLLTELNETEHGKVMVIGATNCPDHCDPALIRKGRMDIRIDVPLPNYEARSDILSFYFQKKKLKLDAADMRKLVVQTKGSAGSELEAFVQEVHLRAIRKVFPRGAYMNMTLGEIREKKKKLLGAVLADIRGNEDSEEDEE